MPRSLLVLMLASALVACGSPARRSEPAADLQVLHPFQAAPNSAAAPAEIVSHAIGFLGQPYRYGSSSFDAGFDCSGFVRAVVERTMGLQIPRQAEQQAAATLQIAASELQAGDLVFFNTMNRAFSHVGIYVGNGQFIHSPRAGAQVRIEDMRKAYWTQRFDGARRILVASLSQVRVP